MIYSSNEEALRIEIIMIETYTASPILIEKADLSYVGAGTNVARHGYGMYFGELETASHYLKQYESYKQAVLSITSGDVIAYEGDEQFEAMKRIHDDPSLWDEEYEEWMMDPLLVEIADEAGPDRPPSFAMSRGVIHRVQLRGVEVRDLTSWDDPVEFDERVALQCALLDSHYSQHNLPAIPWHLFDSPAPPSEMKPSELVEYLFDCVINLAYEEDRVDVTIDRDELFAAWWEMACKNEVDLSFEIGRDDTFDAVAQMSLKALVEPGVELEPSITYGSAYGTIASTLSSTREPDIKAASDIFSRIGKIGFIGDAVEGRYGAKEYVVFDRDVLKNATFEALTPREVDDLKMAPSEPSNDNDYDYAPRVGY